MTAVQQKLAAAGIAKDAIRTIAAELQLESDWVNGRQVPKRVCRAQHRSRSGWMTSTRVGEVIDIAVAGGATAVHGVRFDLKQRESLEREALKRATADARARAEAAALGRRPRDRSRHSHRGARHAPDPPPQPMMMMRQSAAAERRRPRSLPARSRFGRTWC